MLHSVSEAMGGESPDVTPVLTPKGKALPLTLSSHHSRTLGVANLVLVHWLQLFLCVHREMLPFQGLGAAVAPKSESAAKYNFARRQQAQTQGPFKAPEMASESKG